MKKNNLFIPTTPVLKAIFGEFILIYFSAIVKQAIFANVNHARICSWNQPVLSNEGKVSCSR